MNLAHEDPVRAKQAYDAFLDDLRRCEALGIGLYNFQSVTPLLPFSPFPFFAPPPAPGRYVFVNPPPNASMKFPILSPGAAISSARPPAIARIAAQLNASHAATSSVTTVLETMAGGGTAIGSSFSDLAAIIALISDKSRIGVCLDTCHVFAAGYDLRSRAAFDATLAKFDAEVGLRYLKAVHLNDSKAPLGSRLDRHANIGTGFLGLGAFWNIMNDSRFEGIPMVLETPAEDEAGKEDKGVYAREIKLLESLVGMEREGEKFSALEKELARRGEAERKVAVEKFEKKESKAAKAKEKEQGEGEQKSGSKGKGKETDKGSGQRKLEFKGKGKEADKPTGKKGGMAMKRMELAKKEQAREKAQL